MNVLHVENLVKSIHVELVANDVTNNTIVQQQRWIRLRPRKCGAKRGVVMYT